MLLLQQRWGGGSIWRPSGLCSAVLRSIGIVLLPLPLPLLVLLLLLGLLLRRRGVVRGPRERAARGGGGLRRARAQAWQIDMPPLCLSSVRVLVRRGLRLAVARAVA